jgi:predicted PurR-regulated permease PerM
MLDRSRQSRSFLPVLLGLAAIVLILIGLHLAAPFLSPFLFAPIHAWFQRRRLPAGVALLLVLSLQAAIFGTLIAVLSVSLRRFTARLGTPNAATSRAC